jgi:hypothetical protein
MNLRDSHVAAAGEAGGCRAANRQTTADVFNAIGVYRAAASR